jgi:hypothetical protein
MIHEENLELTNCLAAVHKVHIYQEYHSVCPLVRNGTPPTPLPQASVPPRTEGGGWIQSNEE